MAPATESRNVTPQSDGDLPEERLMVLKGYHDRRDRLRSRLLTIEGKILETSAFNYELIKNIDESSELIATMCDILESEPNTTDSSDLLLTLMEDISAEELSRERNLKLKDKFAQQIFLYNNVHTEVMNELSELEIRLSEMETNMQVLEQIVC